MRQHIKALGRFLVSLADEPATAAVPPQMDAMETPAGRVDTADAQAAKLVRNAPEEKQDFASGSLEVIGIPELKADLGERWPAVEKHVRSVIEDVLRNGLTTDDVYSSADGERYVIIFGKANAAGAAKACSAFRTQILERLSHLASQDTILDVAHNVITIKRQTLSDADDVFNAAIAELRKIDEDIQRSNQASRQALIEGAETRYVPVMTPQGQRTSVFVSTFDTKTARELFEYSKGLDRLDDLLFTVCQMDCRLLTEAIVELHRMNNADKKVTLVVPIHFQSLNWRKTRERFLAVAGSVPEIYQERLLFKIYGLPQALRISRLNELLPFLFNYCQGVVLETDDPEELLGEEGVRGVVAVTKNFAPGGMPRSRKQRDKWMRRLKRYRKKAHACRVKAIAIGVRSPGEVAAANEAGFDLVSCAGTRDMLKSLREIAWDGGAKKKTAA